MPLNDQAGAIVVLGSPNSPEGKLYSVALQRCTLAYSLYRELPDWKILLTGGFGNHFNVSSRPHAAYLKDELSRLGVSDQAFLDFAESLNTLQDASLARPILQKAGIKRIIVVTSDYHGDRARYIFEQEFTETDITLDFRLTKTDPSACEFDLKSQIVHEKQALVKLRNSSNV